MECMGFSLHWINLIHECISSVTYQMIINGGQSGAFVPQRGIRQDDPLFPYIFILCQNILSMLLFEAESCNKIQVIKISRGSPPLSRMFYADDSYIFFRTNVQACRAVKAILNEFCLLSGHKINLNKPELFLSPIVNTKKVNGSVEFSR